VTEETQSDRLAIRDVVESWVIARDSGDWEWFRRQWHDDGYMMATWFQGPVDDFIRVSQEGFARGVSILHFTGASQATVHGSRAIAQTRKVPRLPAGSGWLPGQGGHAGAARAAGRGALRAGRGVARGPFGPGVRVVEPGL